MVAWLNRLRLCQNAIDTILSLPSQHELANKCRYTCVIHLFHKSSHTRLINAFMYECTYTHTFGMQATLAANSCHAIICGTYCP